MRIDNRLDPVHLLAQGKKGGHALVIGMLLGEDIFDAAALEKVVRGDDNRIVERLEAVFYLVHHLGIRNAEPFDEELLGHAERLPGNRRGNGDDYQDGKKKQGDEQALVFKTFWDQFHLLSPRLLSSVLARGQAR